MTRLADPFSGYDISKSHEQNIKDKTNAMIESMTREVTKKPIIKQFEYIDITCKNRYMNHELSVRGRSGWEAYHIFMTSALPKAYIKIYFKRELNQE